MSPLERQDSATGALAGVRGHYPEVYVIIGPPRSSSTALARVFWEQPSIRYYCHEPFEIAYFRDASLGEVESKLLEPLDLSELGTALEPEAEALVVKEMPYQVGDHFPLLTELATAPIVFLIRDPRLNIASRMEKKLEVGDNPIFPLVETGWELLRDQIEYCREHGIDHVVVTAESLRDRPLETLPELFDALRLEFDQEMVTWKPCEAVEIDNLEGDHSHLYRSVLSSTGLEPEVEPPAVQSFPEEGGFRRHVGESLAIYEALKASAVRIG